MSPALPDLQPLPDAGEHMELDEFIEAVEFQEFDDEDGTGYYATDTAMSDVRIYPSDVYADPPRLCAGWTHVVWLAKAT